MARKVHTPDQHSEEPPDDSRIGLERITEGLDAAEESLHEVFRVAIRDRSRLRFLRIAGPSEFRSEVIGLVTRRHTMTRSVKALLDDKIPGIEFVLADPYSETFLARMDSEGKANPEVWRVRHEVLEFVRGLLVVSALRVRADCPGLVIAFHSESLQWNMCITGDNRVVVRAYYQAATGHGPGVPDIHLRAGSDARLAESFITYYESVKNDPKTRFIYRKSDLDGTPEWPSVFKSNALKPCEDNPGGLVKISATAEGRNVEAAWLGARCHEAGEVMCFRPVALLQQRIAPDKCFGGHGLALQHVDGVTAEQLAFELQRVAGKRPELLDKATLALSVLVGQAFQALKEFRLIRRECGPTGLPGVVEKEYPWSEKLRQAISEAGRFITRDRALLAKCYVEAVDLGAKLRDRLQNGSGYPFRDAHLKNRLVAIDRGWARDEWAGFGDWLEGVDRDAIDLLLRERTYDIDFETCDQLVTDEDDPLHVICSPNLGLAPEKLVSEAGPLLEEWWGRPYRDFRNELRKVLLCRALREVCRRVWYASVMPNTYEKRYATESVDHFLRISREAVRQLQGCAAIEQLLSECWKNRHSIWPRREQPQWGEPVHASAQLYTGITSGGARATPERGNGRGSMLPLLPRRTDTDSPESHAMDKLTILFLAANPQETAQLKLEGEHRAIQKRIRASPKRDRLDLVCGWKTQPVDLHEHFLENRPHVVHFSGHGSRTGEIVLESADNRSQPVRKTALRNLFANLGGHIRVVVLNACYSEDQARLITEVVDCALGMAVSIDDEAAIAFAAEFYYGIGFGLSVKEAFNLGVNQLDLSGLPGTAIPRLHTRHGVDAGKLYLT